MAFYWKDKVVFLNVDIIICSAVVKILLEEGIKHVAIWDINVEAGKSLQDEINGKYGENKVKFIKRDVSDEDQLERSFQVVLEEQGYIDVVINYCFEINDSKKGFKKMINTNFTSIVDSTLNSIEIMSKENGGRGGTVINVTSVVALFQSHLLPIYSATKSAILQFSNCIGKNEYYSRSGVKIITVAIGAFVSPLLPFDSIKSFDKHIEATLEEELSQFPMQRIESIAQGLVDAYKQGVSGSTWLSTSERPIEDITANIKEAYDLMSGRV